MSENSTSAPPAQPAAPPPPDFAPEAPAAPVAKRVPIQRTFHGDTVTDDYEWLRDKDNAEVIAHLEAENAYTAARTAGQDPLRQAIFDQIKSRTRETDMSVPVRRGDYWYFARTFEGKDYPAQCRIPAIPSTADGAWNPPTIQPGKMRNEHVLLDLNAEAAGHQFFSLGAYSISAHGKFLGWSADIEGDERYTLKIRDLATGKDLPDAIPGTVGQVYFDRKAQFVFYTTVDEAWRPDTVWRHRIGTTAQQDVQVFHEADERYFVGMTLSRSKKYLFFVAGSKLTSDWWYVDATSPEDAPAQVRPKTEGVEYSVEHAVIAGESRFLITHNANRADFEISDVPVIAQKGADPARPVLADLDGKRIEDVEAFSGFLAISYREGGFARVGVIDLGVGVELGEGEKVVAAAVLGDATFTYPPMRELAGADDFGSMGIGGNPEWAQEILRMGYTSWITPSQVLAHDVATGATTVLKQQEVLHADVQSYRQRLEWATAADGTKIPVSIVWRPDKVNQYPAPAVLYGYGSYEASMDPYFSIARLSLLDRGVIWAVAHVRGGGEMGRAWYDNGKTLTKKNTFTDFVDVADHLIHKGLTRPDRLVAMGGSAGGLLMGAVANIGYDRIAGISAEVPFVDALTSMLKPELPLTVTEWDEWGDPLHDPEVYRYMKSYSPYENVGDHPYPKILATTSLNDTRVLYVEPAKWTARLREVGADVLLKTEMVAGHGGVSGRYDAWRDTAFEFAWVLTVLGAGQEP